MSQVRRRSILRYIDEQTIILQFAVGTFCVSWTSRGTDVTLSLHSYTLSDALSRARGIVHEFFLLLMTE